MSTSQISPQTCRQCGCHELMACTHSNFGSCWWAEEATPMQGPLCSHCEMENSGVIRKEEIVRPWQKTSPPSSRLAVQIARKLSDTIRAITWDRYTQTDEGFFVVYGWIGRTDGQRDFLVVMLWEYDKPEDVFYTTSSAKYSEEVSRVLYGTADGHNACRKIDELFAGVL